MTELLIWKKQEKRIVKLLYNKGLLKDFKVKELYWASYNRLRTKKKKHHRKYRHTVYLPEIHYGTVDYWGEGDEHGLVRFILDVFYWGNVDPTQNLDDGKWPESSFKIRSRTKLIQYLEKLPTVRTDSKINKILIMNNDE